MVTSIEAMVEFKHPLFRLEQNTKQWQAFHSLPRMATSIEANRMLLKLTRVAKKIKRPWTYMRDKGVDLPYLFLHRGFSIVTSLAYPQKKKERKKNA